MEIKLINEIKDFAVYLNKIGHFIAILVILLLYKFGERIGTLSKLKVSDLSENNQIIFHERIMFIIRRFLLNETFSLIHCLIFECNLKDNEFLFHDYKFKSDAYKRDFIFISENKKFNDKFKSFQSPYYRKNFFPFI
jgi:hypothetical protein